jgi:hypothetical protein
MFNKEYPKSCTMFGISFENSFKTNHGPSQACFTVVSTQTYFGSGSWKHSNAGMVSTWEVAKDSSTLLFNTGFRVSIYVQ